MALIATLVSELKLDSKSFLNSLSTTEKAVKGFANNIKVPLLAAAAVVVTAFTAAFAGLTSIIAEQTQKISELFDTATSLNSSVASIQRLHYAAEQSGISVSAMDSSVKKMILSVGAASKGNKKLSETFSALGLDAKYLSTLEVDKQYIAIAEAIKRIPNAAAQASVVKDIFGKGGFNQLRLIRDDVKGLTDEFTKFGGEISGPQAKAVEQYGDNIVRLSTLWEAFKIQLTVKVVPAFDALITWITKTIMEMGGMEKAAQFVASAMISAIQWTVAFFQGLVTNANRAIVVIEELLVLLLRVNQIGTLGLSNIIAGTGDKIDSLQKDIASRNKSIANPATAGLQQQLTNAQSQVSGQNGGGNKLTSEGVSAGDQWKSPEAFKAFQTGVPQKVDVGIQLNVSPDLVAKVVNSPENAKVIIQTSINTVAEAARAGAR